MGAPTIAKGLTAEETLAAAAEARRRLRRRRTIASSISLGAMILLVVAAVVFTIGFNNSWWVQKHPPASSNQQATDGSSVFTQAGIDYFTHEGVVKVAMTASRPTSAELGLPRSGSTHVDFSIPLAVRATGTGGSAEFDQLSSIDVVTAGGRVSTVDLTVYDSYQALIGDVESLASRAGWSDADIAKFRDDLQASRLQHHAQAYSATIGAGTTEGIPISATVSADQQSDPHLVIHLSVAP